ncbi:hypothetical protein LJR251_002724 [Rhizobium rhizogenes]|uniref:hypothetical protein n=1 Tax=Rhizobium rhizogenes TaxID=359 RepID=UPI003ECE74E0
MTWANRLLSVLTDALATELAEDANNLTAEMDSIDEGLWSRLQALRSDQVENKLRVRLSYASSSDGHDLLSEEFDDLVNGKLKLICGKTQISGILRFFYCAHFSRFTEARPEAVELCEAVFIGDLQNETRTKGLIIRPWTGALDLKDSHSDRKSPRQIVNDATGKGIVPASVAVWLPEGTDLKIDDLLGRRSSRRLALALPASLFDDGQGSLSALADLKRKITAPIEAPSNAIWLDGDLTSKLNQAADWVYCEGPDCENRHSLLSAEIARSFPKGKSWAEGLAVVLEGSIDSAKIAYRLHLYDKSIDALKLMSDLRKGLADDVKAVSAQTSALASGLWKDAAVAMGAIAIKSFGGPLSTLVLILSGIYLIASGCLNKRVACRSVKAIEDNEKVFRVKLYSALLATDEYSELAGARYAEVTNEFYLFSKIVFCIYILSAIVLMAVAVYPYEAAVSAFATCTENHFAHYFGRLGMPDAIALRPFLCSSNLQ